MVFTIHYGYIGYFHLHLKVCPPQHCIPQNLVARVKEDSMTFWSTLDQHNCMNWQLSDIKSVSLHKGLNISIQSAKYVNQ